MKQYKTRDNLLLRLTANWDERCPKRKRMKREKKKHHRPTHKYSCKRTPVLTLIECLIATFHFKSGCFLFRTVFIFFYMPAGVLCVFSTGISVAKICAVDLVCAFSMRMEIHIIIFTKREKTTYFRVLSQQTHTERTMSFRCRRNLQIFSSQFSQIWTDERERKKKPRRSY